MTAGAFVREGYTSEDYALLGVAAVFQRVEGKLQQVLVLEPLPSSSVECIVRLGVPTSFKRLFGTNLGALSDALSEMPPGVINEGEKVAFADNFTERLYAAVRTFRRSPEYAAMVPPGKIVDELNFNLEKKRILNEKWEPNFEDNVKQDMSIDVYDRQDSSTEAAVSDLYNA